MAKWRGQGTGRARHHQHSTAAEASESELRRLPAELPRASCRSEKGAFTGAATTRIGKSNSAFGTIFLDEIGELKPPLQASAPVLPDAELRSWAAKEDQRRRAGGDSTNRDLEQMLMRGEFRGISITG